MDRLTEPAEVWTATPADEELAAGVRYASISLPWTFDRMMMRSSPAGQASRAYNIAKGIVGQEVLVRLLRERDVPVEVPRDSHRDDDLFDVRLEIDGEWRAVDLKTMNYFSDYGDDRPPFSLEYVLENREYDGPEWRRFFPMLIPHTQMNQGKEVYVFAIAESIDFRDELAAGRSTGEFFAFPHGEFCEFVQKERLIRAREAADAGIFVSIRYETMSYFEDHLPELELIGEWDGAVKRERITLRKNEPVADVGPFSALSSIRMPAGDFRENFSGALRWSISRNDLDDPVRNTTRRNLNVVPRARDDVDGEWPMTIETGDFRNLRLPDDYRVHFLGWTTKAAFEARCRTYRSYVWPDDDVDPDRNQPWSQLTDDDRSKLERIGFDDAIRDGDHRIGAGFLKGLPHAGSASTYVYPNQHGAGLRETNLYVLPGDLRVMETLTPSS